MTTFPRPAGWNSKREIRDWGLGRRDWGLGIRDWTDPCSLATDHRPLATVSRPSPLSSLLSPPTPVSRPSPLSPLLSPLSRRGFTLVELLVTITIIGMLAGMMWGALQMARNSARDAATKATITKLNNIIMQRYESYMTRRVPISTTGLSPTDAAKMRLACLRDLMRMEMPDHYSDFTNAPKTFTYGGVSRSDPAPALYSVYNHKYSASNPASGGVNEPGKCLYLLISTGSPEAMEQFSQSEIGVDSDGWQYFVDGWGSPIFFLRWAPGFSSNWTLMNPPYTGFSGLGPGYPTAGPSDIQSGDPVNDHDPFDSHNVDATAFRMVPLTYSTHGLTTASCVFIGDTSYQYAGNPYQTFLDSVTGKNLLVGTPTSNAIAGIITNHHIEQR